MLQRISALEALYGVTAIGIGSLLDRIAALEVKRQRVAPLSKTVLGFTS